MTDEALMLAVRDGQVHCLGVLFERHRVRMYRFFRRSVSDPSTSEDLVQALFTRMLEYRSGYRGGSFTAWMYKVAINLRNDHLRRERARYVTASVDDLHAPEGAASADTVRLRAALDALRPGERDVLVLTRFEGLPYEQAAEVLGCTVGALKVRVHRALRSLRERYAERRGAPWE